MPTGVQTALAFVVALLGPCLFLLLYDPTPLLAEPKPDLDWLLGLLGVAAGLWSASRITGLPYLESYLERHRVGAVALWIMVPVWLGFGLASAAERTQEMLSFRDGGVKEEISVVAKEKSRRSSRGRVSYDVDVMSPYDGRTISIPIDGAMFDTIEPNRGCVAIMIERAPNGATRVLKPVRWDEYCPWQEVQ
jgi:hypothetical protein